MPRRTPSPVSPALAAVAAAAVSLPAAAAPEWQTRTWVQPAAGANVFGANGDSVSAATIGARAGLDYWETGRGWPKIRGTTRVAFDYMITSQQASGWEARVGSFAGPTWKHVGLSVGPDFFINQWTFGGVTLPQAAGVSAPVIVNGQYEMLGAYAGVEPAWYFSGDREGADWDELGKPGIGDEFALLAGVSARVKSLTVGAHWRKNTTAYGENTSFGISANVTPPAITGSGGGKKGGGKKGRK
jgi:hypothetical protein